MAEKFIKDPEAVSDYAFDWSDWLEEGDQPETILSHVITVPEGMTLDRSEAASGIVTVWLSAGLGGETYRVECKITTSKGRTEKRSIWITVQER